MQITLTYLNLNDPQPVLEGQRIGYPCEFTSEIGGGPAWLALQRSPGELSKRTTLWVDLLPGAVGDLQPLPGQPAGGARLEPLPGRPGDFSATGVVTSLVWLDDEREDALLEVMAGPALFSFPAELAGGSELEWGGWVWFTLQGLVLREQAGGL